MTDHGQVPVGDDTFNVPTARVYRQHRRDGGRVMSCCGTSRPINPARPGDTGRWVLPRSPARSARCVHTYVYRNQLDLVGGPVVKVCTGCGYTVHPTWVPDVGARLALPAVQTFQVGEAEWVEATPHGRGAA